MDAPLITSTEHGLLCGTGPDAFYIDPWRPVERAVITHAHADHAVPGCGSYLTSPSGAIVLKARLGHDIRVQPLEWRQRLAIGEVTISLHPAGHVLGSAQIRLERISRSPGTNPDDGGTWCISGDYFTRADELAGRTPARPGIEPFEPVPCHTFLSESTFGLPIYRWPSDAAVFAEINDWWRENAANNITSIIYGYSLGKAQRILLGIDPAIGPIAAHGSVARMNEAYRAANVPLPNARTLMPEALAEIKGRGLVLAPPSASGNAAWVRKLAGKNGISDAFASGWMRVRGKRRWRSFDRGFVLSDHADWPGLLAAIGATGAARIGTTHGSAAVLARWMQEAGSESFIVPTRYEGESLTGDDVEPTAAPQAPADTQLRDADPASDETSPGGPP